jgi:hypothetical protein
MSVSLENSVTAEDWSKAEALALQYLQTEQHPPEPISLRRFEATPFLFGAWWTGGGTHVLVYDGKVHPERGVAALPGYFQFLGPARLSAINLELLDGMLQALDASRPVRPDLGQMWRWVEDYKDLLPTLRDHDGTLAYVVHFVVVAAPLPPPLGGPPGLMRRPGGSRLSDKLVLQRWSLQLAPVVPDLDWKFEQRIERPELATKTP